MNLSIKSHEERNGKEATNALKANSIYISYKNERVKEHNLRQLEATASETNPVAIIRTKTHGALTGKADRRHFDSKTPSFANTCTGSIVAISGRNFQPLWGLHNGACGTVVEIVFQQGRSPNTGDMPEYVVVDFPHYCGPTWDSNNAGHVPIPIVEHKCEKGCCTRHYLPLTLAWARTIHKFQGQSAGPVDENQIPNTFECIICDPDTKESEHKAMGLFYTAISRATTLGDDRGDNSAIYFDGDSYNENRIRNIGRRKHTDQDTERVSQRTAWVNCLQQHKRKWPTPKTTNEIGKWAETTKYTEKDLKNRINEYKSIRLR